MNLKECRDKAKQILSEFIDSIGYDGKYYVSQTSCPMMWGKPKFGGIGEYIEPESERLKFLLSKSNLDESIKKKVFSSGLIVIDKRYMSDLSNPDLYGTIIHETIHANRNLLLYDAIRKNSNEKAYLYDDGVLKQVSNDYGFSFVDASQNVLKGNIDNSVSSINSYSNEKIEELDELEYREGKRDEQFDRQQRVDEALVELMSVLSYKLYVNKNKGLTTNIWELLEETKKFFSGQDISIICEIIIRHHDFELFNWMIDPISYSMGDIHYDFFKDYTKNDSDLVEKLYSLDGFSLDDFFSSKSM